MAPSYPRGSWFEQTWISTISGSFHINFSFPGPVVLEKKIFKWHHPIFAFSWLSPLWRGPGPSFEQTWSPFTQGWCVPSLVEFGPAVLEKKSKMWKVNGQTDRRTDGQTDRQTDRRTDGQTTDNRRSEKLTWTFGSGEDRQTEWFLYTPPNLFAGGIKILSQNDAVFHPVNYYIFIALFR